MIFDPMYFLFIGPGLLLSLWASFRVKSAFNKYSKVRSMRGLTGAEAAQEMLRYAGISDVRILRAHGILSDHYNPLNRTLNLSEAVYESNSIAAVGVATSTATPVEDGAGASDGTGVGPPPPWHETATDTRTGTRSTRRRIRKGRLLVDH